jgi:hypothetical protein
MTLQCGIVQSYDNVLGMSLKNNKTVLYVQNFEKRVYLFVKLIPPLGRRGWDDFSTVPKFY